MTPRPCGAACPCLGSCRAELAVLEVARRQQGDFGRLAAPSRQPLFLLGRPEHIRHILQDNHANYRRTPFFDRLKVVLGEGLVTGEGEPWRRQRRLIRPACHHFPFGGGPRACIGHHFAMTEMLVVLAVLAARFDFRPPAGGALPARAQALVTLRPVGGRLPVQVARR